MSGVVPTIRKLNYSHEAIARWLLANPDSPLKECAQFFGYTQGWLSIIIHSDAFQLRYRQMQQDADTAVIADIPTKLRSIASMALDGLAEQVAVAAEHVEPGERKFLLETSDSMLSKLGYGGAKNVVVNAQPGSQVNVVDAESLARARARLLEAPREEKVVAGELVPAAT